MIERLVDSAVWTFVEGRGDRESAELGRGDGLHLDCSSDGEMVMWLKQYDGYLYVLAAIFRGRLVRSGDLAGTIEAIT